LVPTGIFAAGCDGCPRDAANGEKNPEIAHGSAEISARVPRERVKSVAAVW